MKHILQQPRPAWGLGLLVVAAGLWGCGQEREHCNLRRVEQRVTQVSGDCRGADLEGVDLSGADLSGVRWGNTTCPDGANSDEVGGSCERHLSPDPCAACAPDERCREGRCVVVEAPDLGADAADEDARDLDAQDGAEDASQGDDARDVEPQDDAEPSDDAPQDAPDEGCESDPLLCDLNASCHLELDPPECQCNEGFEGDGEVCRAAQALACDQPFLCPIEADCVDLPDGAYRCDCGPNLAYDRALDDCVLDCRALDFGGQAVATRAEPNEWLASAWTLEAWIYPRASDAPQTLLHIVYERAAPLWVMVRLLPAEDNGFMAAEFVLHDDGLEQRATLPGASVGAGRWSHLAFDSFSIFYLNGVGVEVEPIRGTGDTLYEGVLHVGARGGDPGDEPWEGLARDVRISNSLRYLGDFFVESRLERDGYTVGLWPLREEAGEVAQDEGPDGLDLRVEGGAWARCPADR